MSSSPAAVLREARARDSTTKRDRALLAVRQLHSSGQATMLPNANGTSMMPVSSAVWPRPACQRMESTKKMLVNAAK